MYMKQSFENLNIIFLAFENMIPYFLFVLYKCLCLQLFQYDKICFYHSGVHVITVCFSVNISSICLCMRLKTKKNIDSFSTQFIYYLIF